MYVLLRAKLTEKATFGFAASTEWKDSIQRHSIHCVRVHACAHVCVVDLAIFGRGFFAEGELRDLRHVIIPTS